MIANSAHYNQLHPVAHRFHSSVQLTPSTRCLQGTSYTITNVEHLSQRSTASNYADGFEVCVPVRPDLAENGPYRHDVEKPMGRYALTKTHCGGYCTDCPPSSYALDVESFHMACRSGFKNESGRKVATTYRAAVPAKAIHLLRNPFDNLVARMHLHVKQLRSSPESSSSGGAVHSLFEDSPEGLAAWCQFLDSSHTKQLQETELIEDIKDAWKDLRCRSEWYRWVQWHNLAVQLAAQLDQQRSQGFPVHRVYYEDYSFNLNQTTDAILAFLELDVERPPSLPFVAGKTYLGLFSDDQQRSAARFVKSLATPELWILIKHYFEGLTA